MVAEDSGLIRQMLAQTLTAQGFEVTGQAGDGDELCRLVQANPPDVAVLDIRMPPTHTDEGIRAALAIRATHPSVGLVVLSSYGETEYAAQLLHEGGNRGIGYLVKERVDDVRLLSDTITVVARGEVRIDSEIVVRLFDRQSKNDPLQRLTDREREVLALMAEGYSNIAIADRIHFSERAVEKHIAAILRKLELTTGDVKDRRNQNVRVLAVLTYLRGTAGQS